METLFLIYDEAFQPEVSAIIERKMVVPRYTRVDNVIGARVAAAQEAGTGYLTDRRNRMIVAIAESATIGLLVSDLQALRRRKEHGLRAFVVPVSAVI